MSAQQRKLAAPPLHAKAKSKPVVKPVRLLPEAELERQALAELPGALEYLPAVQSAKGAALPIPAVFRDHALKGRLKGLRSVVIGDLDTVPDDGEKYIPGSDATFVAVYREDSKRCLFVMLRQHDDAYGKGG